MAVVFVAAAVAAVDGVAAAAPGLPRVLLANA